MKAQDFINSFPSENISNVFSECRSQMVAAQIEPGLIDNTRNQYRKIFDFDEKIYSLKLATNDNPGFEFSDEEVQRLMNYFNYVRAIIEALRALNLTTPDEYNSVIQKFLNLVRESRFLEPIMFKAGGSEIASGKVLIDEFIGDLVEITRFVKLDNSLNNEKILKDTASIKNTKNEVAELLTSLKESHKYAESLITNKEKINEAQVSAENWLATLDKSVDETFKRRSQNFANKAAEHRTFSLKHVPVPFADKFKILSIIKQPSFEGVFVWLLLSFLFGLVAFVIVLVFVYELRNKTELSVGIALLRISSLIVPSYFALFCGQRYLDHRKLFEAYSYRDIVLTSMRELLRERNDRHEQVEILNRSLNIIFSEPTIKDDNNQKQIVNDLKDIIVKKLSS